METIDNTKLDIVVVPTSTPHTPDIIFGNLSGIVTDIPDGCEDGSMCTNGFCADATACPVCEGSASCGDGTCADGSCESGGDGGGD
jgi:hypothetical protein